MDIAATCYGLAVLRGLLFALNCVPSMLTTQEKRQSVVPQSTVSLPSGIGNQDEEDVISHSRVAVDVCQSTMPNPQQQTLPRTVARPPSASVTKAVLDSGKCSGNWVRRVCRSRMTNSAGDCLRQTCSQQRHHLWKDQGEGLVHFSGSFTRVLTGKSHGKCSGFIKHFSSRMELIQVPFSRSLKHSCSARIAVKDVCTS